jgi:chromosome segregation ATPase
MATTPENTLTPNPSTDGSVPAPLWVWLLFLALIGFATYAGYTAVSNYQRYYDTETARQGVARDRDRLKANLADLKQQVASAAKARSEAENALKQSRADTKTASDQVSDLQALLKAAQEKTESMQATVAAAQTRAKQATDAKAALEKEVEGLKSKLADIQAKLDQTLSDLTDAQHQSQSAAPAQP